jgi:hypothetical protein
VRCARRSGCEPSPAAADGGQEAGEEDRVTFLMMSGGYTDMSFDLKPAGLLRRVGIKPMSRKRRRENRIRKRNMITAFGQQPMCQLGPALALFGINVCDGRAMDANEVLLRGRGGSITDPANVTPGCRPCHTWVTEHPIEAVELGLALPSWSQT